MASLQDSSENNVSVVSVVSRSSSHPSPHQQNSTDEPRNEHPVDARKLVEIHVAPCFQSSITSPSVLSLLC